MFPMASLLETGILNAEQRSFYIAETEVREDRAACVVEQNQRDNRIARSRARLDLARVLSLVHVDRS